MILMAMMMVMAVITTIGIALFGSVGRRIVRVRRVSCNSGRLRGGGRGAGGGGGGSNNKF
jgi:hypothetical protein